MDMHTCELCGQQTKGVYAVSFPFKDQKLVLYWMRFLESADINPENRKIPLCKSCSMQLSDRMKWALESIAKNKRDEEFRGWKMGDRLWVLSAKHDLVDPDSLLRRNIRTVISTATEIRPEWEPKRWGINWLDAGMHDEIPGLEPNTDTQIIAAVKTIEAAWEGDWDIGILCPDGQNRSVCLAALFEASRYGQQVEDIEIVIQMSAPVSLGYDPLSASQPNLRKHCNELLISGATALTLPVPNWTHDVTKHTPLDGDVEIDLSDFGDLPSSIFGSEDQ